MHEGRQAALSPDQAVDRLEAMHAEAVQAQRDALARFAAGGAPPDPEERSRFRYPELRAGVGAQRACPSYPPRLGKIPGARRLCHHGHPARLLPSLSARAVAAAGRGIRRLHPGARQRPGDALPLRARSWRRTRWQATSRRPSWRGISPPPCCRRSATRWPDGLWTSEEGQPWPLALFDAVRVDYSLRRLLHYTGTDWRSIQPWILLTNYQRYVDQFVHWGLDELADPASPYDRLIAARRRHRRPRRRLRPRPRRGSPPRRGTASRCPPIT